jgi:hypothetical protein
VAAPSPSSQGRLMSGLASPIHALIPGGIPSLAAVSLLLAACYWLFRSPAINRGGLG